MADDNELDPLADLEERRVLFAALDSFRQYRHAAHYNITHLRRQSFYSLPAAQVDLLSEPPFNIPATLRAVDDAIDHNANIADQILSLALSTYGIDPSSTEYHGYAKPNDMDKVRSTIRQLYRDWSSEGSAERSASFDPLIDALNSLCQEQGIPPSQRSRLNVLVPGAGLGRLAFEICRNGYGVEGNEISYHQLFVSNFMLNFQPEPFAHAFYPWALGFSNHLRRENQLQKCMIPDISPAKELDESSRKLGSEIHAYERMSMSSGDFCVLYKQPEYEGAFDAVVTCFFIDTAPNPISYIETVRKCLKDGGWWINLGPLLWHFDGGGNVGIDKAGGADQSGGSSGTEMRDKGIGEAGSVELSQDEVIHLVTRLGFDVIRHEPQGREAGYIQDPTSMLQNMYRPAFWIAKKKGKR